MYVLHFRFYIIWNGATVRTYRKGHVCITNCEYFFYSLMKWNCRERDVRRARGWWRDIYYVWRHTSITLVYRYGKLNIIHLIHNRHTHICHHSRHIYTKLAWIVTHHTCLSYIYMEMETHTQKVMDLFALKEIKRICS